MNVITKRSKKNWIDRSEYVQLNLRIAITIYILYIHIYYTYTRVVLN